MEHRYTIESDRKVFQGPPRKIDALPTAAVYPVDQDRNPEAIEAQEALRAQHAARFGYRSPGQREIENIANAVIEFGDSVVTFLLVQILQNMPLAQRLEVIDALAALESLEARKAHAIALTTVMTIDQEIDLCHEIRRIRYNL